MRSYVFTHMNTHVYPYNMNTYTHSSKELVDEVLNFSNIKKSYIFEAMGIFITRHPTNKYNTHNKCQLKIERRTCNGK